MIFIRKRSVPLFLPLLAAIGGIAAGKYFEFAGFNCFFIPAILMLSFAALFLFFKRKYIPYIAFLLSVTFFFAALTVFSLTPSSKDVSQMLPFEGIVRGKLTYSNRQTVMKVLEAVIGYERYSVSGNIILRNIEEVPAPGSVIEAKGFFYSPSVPDNPGQFNWRQYLARNGIFTEGTIDELKVVSETFPGMHIGRIREYMTERIKRFLPEREGEILAGMLLGNPGMVSPEIKDIFMRSGVMHILAVSGLHVGLMLYCIYFLAVSLGVGRKKSYIIALAVMYVYVLAAGARPSSIRAAVMFSLLVAGHMTGGRGNAYNSLCFAAIGMLALKPGLFFLPGFVMSFLAVAGIIYITPAISKYLGRLFSASLSASVSLFPVLAWNFFYISVFSPITNLIVIPMAGIIVSLGMLFLVFAGISNTMGAIYAVPLVYSIKIVEFVTETVALSGLAGFSLGRPPLSIITGYYIILAGIGVLSRKRKILIVSAGAIILVFGIVAHRIYPKNFIAVLCDNGRYSVVYSEDPGRMTVFTGKNPVPGRILRDFIHSSRVSAVNDMYIMHPIYGDMRDMAYYALNLKTKRIMYPGIEGNRIKWYDFKNIISGIELLAPVRGDIFRYRNYNILVSEPHHKYVDIRDNVMQCEIRGGQNIFVYTGGEIPAKDFDIVIAIEPHKPEWDRINNICRGLIIYLGNDPPPRNVYWIRNKGRIFKI